MPSGGGIEMSCDITYHFYAGDSPEYVKKALEVGQPDQALIVEGEPEWFWEAFKAQTWMDYVSSGNSYTVETYGVDIVAQTEKAAAIRAAEKEKQTDL